MICGGKTPKLDEDYQALASFREIDWVGVTRPPNVATPTQWRCRLCGTIWLASYGNVSGNKSGCPHCVDMVNGRKVSNPQRRLCSLLGGQLNYPVGAHAVDIALMVGEARIAIEYDSWFWHAGKEQADLERDKYLIAAGWHVLRIKSNNTLPTQEILREAIGNLFKESLFTEIRLDDWGQGPTAYPEAATRSKASRAISRLLTTQAVNAPPEECVGELDRRSLYIRRGDTDLLKVSLTPQEALLLKRALDNGSSPSFMIFTLQSVRQALGKSKLEAGAIRTAMGRLRKLATFSGPHEIGLISCITKGQYRTSIMISPRPIERISQTIQTGLREWRAFNEARDFVRDLSLRTQKDWYAYAMGKLSGKGIRPSDVPWNPQRTYKNKGWKNWNDWLTSPLEEPLFDCIHN
jgi:very-short-patch-repair endonuclease